MLWYKKVVCLCQEDNVNFFALPGPYYKRHGLHRLNKDANLFFIQLKILVLDEGGSFYYFLIKQLIA